MAQVLDVVVAHGGALGATIEVFGLIAVILAVVVGPLLRKPPRVASVPEDADRAPVDEAPE